MTIVAVIFAGWLGVGAAVGLVEARHGYWRRGWVVSAVLGPFAVPLALQRRRVAAPGPVVLARGGVRRGLVDVLVGLDGSSESMAAATVAIRLFGPRIGRVTLATVLDLDTAAPHSDSLLNPEPWPEERAARQQLEGARSAIRSSSGIEPGAVVLAGEPAHALEELARAEDYELIVVGCRGTGLSKVLLGSCASKLARRTAVPVLLVPSDLAHGECDTVTETAAASALR